MRNKTKRNVKSRKNTPIGTTSPRSVKFIRELKTMILKTLSQSQQNNYTKNKYHHNDIDRLHLVNLMETISYPKFVCSDTTIEDSHNHYGKGYKCKKSEPFENELDVLPWWATTNGMDFVNSTSPI